MQAQHAKKHSYLDEYRIIKTLGAGYHAQVKLGEDQQGNLVAIKKYKKETATLDTLKHELNIMKQLEHQNLVRLVSVRENATYKKKDETVYSCFAIVLEYVGGGELFDFVAQTGKFSEKVTRTYFHQMMNGLHFMHTKGYAHRDIKPQNVLLSQLFVLKIADFGFSCLLRGKDGTGVLRTKLGTQGYMAPEIPTKKYEGKSCDIFATGVILFIMLSGNPPFEKATPTDPYYKLIKEKKYDVFWKAHSRKRPVGFFTQSFQDLFVKIVAFEPLERPKIEQIAAHPWVREGVCSHGEIKEEFTQRQKKLDQVLETRRLEQEKDKALKLTAVNTQGSAHRGGSEVDSSFVELYNKEFHSKRPLPIMEVVQLTDIVLKENSAFTIAQLKTFLKAQELNVYSEEEELIGDETDVIRLKKIQDEHGSKINVVFGYSYEVDGTEFQQNIEIEISVGQTTKGEVVLRFERIGGEQLYYKKLVNEIRRKCFAA